MTLDPAEAAYEAIRASTTDIASIARNTGWKPTKMQAVKNHLLRTSHLLDRYVSLGVPAEFRRFDSDLGMAAAWQRLEAGSFTARDRQLLRHEIAEAWYVQRHGPSYMQRTRQRVAASPRRR